MRSTVQALPTLRSVPLAAGWYNRLGTGVPRAQGDRLWGSALGQAIKELLLLQLPRWACFLLTPRADWLPKTGDQQVIVAVEETAS